MCLLNFLAGMDSAILAIAIPSVCLSVCQTPVLCQNDCLRSTVQFELSNSKMCLVC